MIDYNLRKRFFLFIIGCIGLRSYLVYFAKTTSKTNLVYLGYAASVISFGFMFLYIFGLRKSGAEVFGDKIWWNNLRPVHSLLYLLFAYFVFTNNQDAWKFLALDVILGFSAFIYYHYSQGNFNKLM